MSRTPPYMYLPAERTRSAQTTGPKIALHFLRLSVHPHLSRAQYYVRRYYATAVYYCTNRFWRSVGQSTSSKCSFVLPG